MRYDGDDPGNFQRLDEVWLGDAADDAAAERYAVLGGGDSRTGEIRLSLAGVDSRDAALALRGRIVLADAARLPALPEGDHYWFELVGCRVETAEGRVLGTVCELMATGAHDVLVVESADGKRHLIPTAERFLREVDVAARRVVVELVPGLIEEP